MFRPLFIALVASFSCTSDQLSAQAFTTTPRICGVVPPEQSRIAQRVVEAVADRSGLQINRIAAELVDAGKAPSSARDAVLLTLLRWSEESRGLYLLNTCLEKDRASFRYHNALTDQTDEMRLYFDRTGRLARVRVLAAVAPLPQTRRLTDREAARDLDAYARGLSDKGLFSGVVLVGRNGRPIFAQAFGLADRANGQRNKVDSLFNLASLNKIFTATSVLQLVEAGKLSLDTRLGEILPDEVKDTPAAQIQIKHLLSHTSGLMESYKTLSFPPGTSFAYSNMGYGVLGKVIEAVSHLKYEDYVRLHISGPSGMGMTDIYEASQPVSELTTGYAPKLVNGSIEWQPNPLLQTWPGNSIGGFWSSAPDLLKFAEALRGGRLLKKADVQFMRAKKPELGAPDYGFGIIRWRGPGIWGHAGDLPGTSTELEMHCDDGVVLIVLSNRDEATYPVIAKARQLFFRDTCDV